METSLRISGVLAEFRIRYVLDRSLNNNADFFGLCSV